MSKKKNTFRFEYDAPVTLTYAILAALIFILSITLLKDKSPLSLLVSPTNAKGVLPFSFKEPLSYLRLFTHVLGFTDRTVLISDLIFILLLGPQMEERYGSVVIGIMFAVSALFSGVLTACFCQNSTMGAGAPVFMLILLYAMMFLTKNEISGTSIGIILLFIVRSIVQANSNGVVGVIITIAGGLCGSLFALLTSPKAKASRKESRVSRREFDRPVVVKGKAKIKEEKPVKAKSVPKDTSSDETVVGTIKF